MKKLLNYFTIAEKVLFLLSVTLIISSFCIFDRENYLNLFSSLIGVASLIFSAKGNPVGPLLMIFFGLLYGVISYSFSYYGEMITYMGMSVPMAVFAFISWIKNPYKGNKSQVTVNTINKKDILIVTITTVLVTAAFYYILEYFNTASLVLSTVSVTTSFTAVCLTYLRSPYYAIAYALNDIVLILLWVIASIYDTKYICVVVCFIAFLFNDIYGFINWRKLQKHQKA